MSVRKQLHVGRFAAILLLCLLPSSFCPAGTVRTLDGKTHEGDLKFESSGQLTVRPKNGAPVKIDLTDVLQATFRDPVVRVATPRTEGDRLPPPWVAINVGPGAAAAAEPYARYRPESGYSVRSQAGEIGGRADAFVFVRQPASGDADLVCRLDDLAHPTRVAAGLMFRDGSDADAAYVAIAHAAGDLKFLKRDKRGEATDGGPVFRRAPVPVWLRLTRHANTFTAYTSPDGAQWTQLASEVVPMGATSLAGLAVCTRENQPLGVHAQALRLTTQAAAAAASMSLNQPEGVMLRTGTILAGAQIQRADDGSIRLATPDRPGFSVPNVQVARIIFRELTADMTARIPAGRAGVLLRAGDFVEGEFKGIAGGRVQISSVLFGVQRFETGGQAVCAVLNDPEPPKAQFVVRTTLGSIYMAKSATVANDKIVVEDAVAGQFTIERLQVEEITAGPGKLQPLSALKPVKVEAAPGVSPPDACVFETSAKLASITPSNPIALRAACSASWNLNQEYRLLTFKAGVPENIAPTAPVRFVVIGDGKPLYKSPPRTSLDAPIAGSVAVKNVKILTLQMEPTTVSDPSVMPIPIPGLWSDASLVR
jgi:hypothetical protein